MILNFLYPGERFAGTFLNGVEPSVAGNELDRPYLESRQFCFFEDLAREIMCKRYSCRCELFLKQSSLKTALESIWGR